MDQHDPFAVITGREIEQYILEVLLDNYGYHEHHGWPLEYGALLN